DSGGLTCRSYHSAKIASDRSPTCLTMMRNMRRSRTAEDKANRRNRRGSPAHRSGCRSRKRSPQFLFSLLTCESNRQTSKPRRKLAARILLTRRRVVIILAGRANAGHNQSQKNNQRKILI